MSYHQYQSAKFSFAAERTDCERSYAGHVNVYPQGIFNVVFEKDAVSCSGHREGDKPSVSHAAT